MTEEINNLNTDLKELFTENKFEELLDNLNDTSNDIVLEITYHNFDIIKKYYDTEKFNLIFQYIRFVAFTSFVCEYSYKRELITTEEFDKMMVIFNGIYDMLQQNK